MKEAILSGCKRMGIFLQESQAVQMERFYHLLEEGNTRMNLTGKLSQEDALPRHFLDCLSPLCYQDLIPENAHVVDVGSGAGLPGMILSIARPDLHMVMLDSLSKRVKFLRETIQALSLRAEAVHARAEDAAHNPIYRAEFDVATSRAVASLPVLLELCVGFLREGGHIIAYKGPTVEEEIAIAKNAFGQLSLSSPRILSISIPSTNWEHKLLVTQKTAPTPLLYPRKAGLPGKSPL